MKNKSKNEQINHNLKELNLEAIQKTMEHLNITWVDTETGERRVPNKQEISIIASDCMNKAWESECGHAKIGNFEAYLTQGVLEISFVLTKASTLANLLG